MTFAVVACGDCSNYLVISHQQIHQDNEQAECPRCGLTGIGNHGIIDTTEERSAAREIRTERLQRNASQRDESSFSASGFGIEEEITDTIVASKTETEQRKPVNSAAGTPFSSTTEIKNPNSHEQSRQRNSDPTDWQDNTPRAFEDLVDINDIKGKDRFSEQAAKVDRTIPLYEYPTFGGNETVGFPDPNHPTEADTTIKLQNLVTLPIPDDAGLKLTTQSPASKTLTLTGHNPISSIWSEMIENSEIWKYLITGAQYAAANRSYDEFDEILDAVGITDTPLTHAAIRFNLHQLVLRPVRNACAQSNIYSISQDLGTGHSTVEDILATARLFQFVHDPEQDTSIETPTISIEIQYDEFKQRNRNQRENVCELITILSKTFDIRLVSTRVTQSYLRKYHREDLPRVTEWPTAHTNNSRVDEALTAFDVDGGRSLFSVIWTTNPVRHYPTLNCTHVSISRRRAFVPTFLPYRIMISLRSLALNHQGNFRFLMPGATYSKR